MLVSPIDRVVCEVPWEASTPPGFRWYEVSLDKPDMEDQPLVRPRVQRGANVIAATHTTDARIATISVSAALKAGFEHLLFESTEADTEVVSQVREAGAHSIATRHLCEAVGSADKLLAALAQLAETDADVIKVAYPARTASEVAHGLLALDRAKHAFRQPVSVTPMGTAWGRIAAAMGGSCLVFAPLVGTDERPSAQTVLRLLQAWGSASGTPRDGTTRG